MAVTNDPELAQTMALLRSHGITRDSSKFKCQNEPSVPAPHFSPAPLNSPEVTAQRIQPGRPPSFYYEQIALGFNYRMTDLQAALGLSQLIRLNEFVQRRHALTKRYDQLLAGLPVTIPWRHPDTYSGCHLYVIRLKLDQVEKTHRQVFDALREAEIGVNLHYIPVYLQPEFVRLGFRPGHCHEAERYYDEVMTLPLFPSMTDDDVTHVLKALGTAIT